LPEVRDKHLRELERKALVAHTRLEIVLILTSQGLIILRVQGREELYLSSKIS
jgi:hypothetical protein